MGQSRTHPPTRDGGPSLITGIGGVADGSAVRWGDTHAQRSPVPGGWAALTPAKQCGDCMGGTGRC